jgi:hypothetical protein
MRQNVPWSIPNIRFVCFHLLKQIKLIKVILTSSFFLSVQRIEVKDFCIEVRALRDIEIFLANPTTLLNVSETGLEDIMDIMLEKQISKIDGSRINLTKARNAFFTKDSSM